ncbi:class I SAM-dependent methyltransferase [Massilia pseudoviolaceinigra]|uniref:class I SAM-dependent methyltransferase n=1 Tax=Massilia pseudoviolaceinigra TaxID=3057165 RepID=UPI002796BA44|nr:class I SAM-dependent methyltransferase [Massilia sp. CCM 9206]MDQ1923076.1 class I SAM-dependent methyltransferase [Massilia sp. CCM 9206]
MSASIISIDGHRLDQAPPIGIAGEERKAALHALGCALKQHGYAFTTVTPLTHSRVNARLASGWAHDLSGIFGWSRAFKPAVVNATLIDLMHDAEVINHDNGMLRSVLRASTLDGQLYLHSAYPTTAADAVFFGPDTYRFVRAMRASLAARTAPVRRAADIGCGAGPGAITIALVHPGAHVFAADINPAALVLTEINACIAGVTNLTPVDSNLLSAVDGQFDLIVANPPYLIDREQRAYRHGGGDLGAGLSVAIVDEAIKRLAPGGTLMLYTGAAIVANADPFRQAVEPRLRAAGFHWTYDEIDPDVFGEELDEAPYAYADRIAAVWLCATRPDGRA